MDAYEKYLTRFEGLEAPFRRCLHLAESLTSQLGHLLRGATMGYFLEEVGGKEEENNACSMGLARSISQSLCVLVFYKYKRRSLQVRI